MTDPFFVHLPFGPCFTEASMCQLLGIDSTTLRAWAADLQVLQVTTSDGVELYPRFQVQDGPIILGLHEVLERLVVGTDDKWMMWHWLVNEPKRANARPKWDQLRDGEVDAVIRSAEHAGWAWWQ